MPTVIVRQCVGIDISKATFTACFCSTYSSGKVEATEVVKFDNCKTGFNQLLRWVRKNKASFHQCVFVMEATGIYYEPLAYHLTNLKLPVSVVLPNKVKHYGQSFNIKSKTDIIYARIIAQMGAERPLELWQPPSPVLKKLRDLTRPYTDLKVQRTVFENRLQAMKSGNDPVTFIIQSTQSVIKKLNTEIQKCEVQMETLIKSEKWLSEKMNKIITIKGVGLITAATTAQTTYFNIHPLENDTVYEERTKQKTSGNQETKPLLRLNDEVVVENKAGRPTSLPAQDELPSNQSTKALLRLR